MIDHRVAEPVGDQECEHAESPVWDARTGELLWVDQHAGLVHLASLRPGRGVQVGRTYRLGASVGAVTPLADPGEGWLVAAAGGFLRLGRDGRRALLEVADDAPRVRMNDGKCDPSGAFWAGTMAVDASPGAGALYRLDVHGAVRRVLHPVGISNGLSWTADGRRMYYIDSLAGRVDVLRIGDDGLPASRAVAFDVPAASGSPDGMCMDQEGMLWVALWGGGAVRRYTPDGRVLTHVTVAAPQTTSCAFGGTDGRTLFITTSREGYGPDECRRIPAAGRLFAVEVPVAGSPATPYRGPVPPLTPSGQAWSA